MMIGDTPIASARSRERTSRRAPIVLELAGALRRRTMTACRRSSRLNLKVKAGEIVGIAGVSGNGQKELVEVLAGQRPLQRRRHPHQAASAFEPSARGYDTLKVFGLPEEPLKNACVPRMTVAENLAFRTFDKPPVAKLGWWMSPGPMRDQGARADRALQVKTHLARRADRDAVRRQRAARRAGARADRRRRPADRRQPLLRPRLRVGRRDPRADHGAAQPRRGGAAGLRRPRRDPRALRPRRRDVGRHASST